ncbi:MAG: ATP-binding cassette domain-containing protein [Sporichthya sp.]|nr:ATP-binding cassette domain-containing protein [Sporichthya sp.]
MPAQGSATGNSDGIRVRGARRTFGALAAVDHIDLDAPPGAVTALVGPAGSGKTTLLMMLATLVGPDSGEIRVAGRGRRHRRPGRPGRRRAHRGHSRDRKPGLAGTGGRGPDRAGRPVADPRAGIRRPAGGVAQLRAPPLRIRGNRRAGHAARRYRGRGTDRFAGPRRGPGSRTATCRAHPG